LHLLFNNNYLRATKAMNFEFKTHILCALVNDKQKG
jgi:hypothetical protein